MTKEGPSFSQHAALVDRLKGLENRISAGATSSPKDVIQRTNLIVEALQLRAAGDDRIKIFLTGENGDPVDKYSINLLTVVFFTDDISDTELTIESNVQALWRVYRGNIASLISTPDRWLPERPQARAVRLVGRINLIDQDISPTLNDGRPTTITKELNTLKALTAESVFELWSEGKISKESIEVIDDGNSIKVRFIGDRRDFGFRLKPMHMPYGSRLRELVNSALANQSQRKLR